MALPAKRDALSDSSSMCKNRLFNCICKKATLYAMPRASAKGESHTSPSWPNPSETTAYIVSRSFPMSLFLWSTVWWSLLIFRMSWSAVAVALKSCPSWLWSHNSSPPPSPKPHCAMLETTLVYSPTHKRDGRGCRPGGVHRVKLGMVLLSKPITELAVWAYHSEILGGTTEVVFATTMWK